MLATYCDNKIANLLTKNELEIKLVHFNLCNIFLKHKFNIGTAKYITENVA